MGIHRLDELTYERVRALAPGAVAILPVGAIEAHGPHLPLGTDVIIAQAMAEEGARVLAGAGRDVVLLPALSYTPAGFAAAFAGTVSTAPGVATRTVADVVRSLHRNGFRSFAIANAHFDPANVAALRDVAERLRDEGMRVAFPDVTRRALATRLGEEFASGACHAGRYEGSLVLALRPDLVRREIMDTLPPNPASLVDAVRAGLDSFAAAGGERAYFGFPAEATAAEGQRTVAVLGAILAEAVMASEEEEA